MTEVEVLGVRLTAQPFDEGVARLLGAATARSRLRAHFCSVHLLVEATSDASVRDALHSAEMVCTDGMPLVWLARRRGAPDAERVAGPDAMPVVCDRGRSLGLRHFFLGGRPGTPEALATRLTTQYPGLIVAGASSPPFRELTLEEDRTLVEAINAAKPDVLWIGLGSPKQELWAAEHEAALEVPLILPVGAAFDFHSGRVRRAPAWMRRLGLEWLFRLAMEPRRLWRRYLVTNARFIWLVARDSVGRRR